MQSTLNKLTVEVLLHLIPKSHSPSVGFYQHPGVSEKIHMFLS